MAVGFTPKHVKHYSLNELAPSQFLALIHETAIQLEWEVAYISHLGLIAYTNNGVFSWNAEVKIKIENDIAKIQSASTGSEMADLGKNKKNVTKFLEHLEELRSSLTTEDLEKKYEALQDQLVPDEEDILILPPPTTTDQIKGFFSIFIPTEGFFISPILINLNLLLFIAMVVSGVRMMMPDNESLLNWGANFRPMTLEGQWWRLLTCCFIHIGVIHLIMNMYALLYIGVLLEPILGSARFLAAYLLTGVVASVTSLWWHDLTISAGASGAIFGMYGVFLALLTTHLLEKKERKALLSSIAIFVGYNLLYGMKAGVDNAAHLGGLLSGLAIGYAFIPSLKKEDEPKWTFGTIGLLTIVLLISSAIVYKRIPNDLGVYDAKIKTFASMESMALAVYDYPEGTPKEELLHGIKDKGIYYWNECIQLIDSFNELDLPDEFVHRNKLLREYCELRLKSYELLYQAVLSGTNEYQSQIDLYNRQIEAKVEELNPKEK